MLRFDAAVCTVSRMTGSLPSLRSRLFQPFSLFGSAWL